jgi:hypothetical protein
MTNVVTVVAVLACTLFAGAAIYINVVEHPARLSCGTEIAARQWAPSYRRATVQQEAARGRTRPRVQRNESAPGHLGQAARNQKRAESDRIHAIHTGRYA